MGAVPVTGRQAIRLFLIVVLVLVVQYTVALDLRVAGTHPDLMMLLPIVGGAIAGPEFGAGIGFVAGIATDLLLPTPFGLSALVYCLLGFGVGMVTSAGPGRQREAAWWLTALIALAASAAGVMLYAVLGAILGQQQMVHVDLAAVVSVVAVVNALAAPLAARLVSWGLDQPVSRADRRRRARLMERSVGRAR